MLSLEGLSVPLCVLIHQLSSPGAWGWTHAPGTPHDLLPEPVKIGRVFESSPTTPGALPSENHLPPPPRLLCPLFVFYDYKPFKMSPNTVGFHNGLFMSPNAS